MAGEYVYNLQNLTKQHNKKTVLEEVTLAFFFGAKIGVIGGNGSGKSSLLRIMAGEDTEYMGQVQIAKRARIGYLPQEPQLDPSKTVLGNVMEGVAASQAVLDRYNEIWELLAGEVSDEESEKLNEEVALRRTRSIHRISGTSKVRSRWRWIPCACRRATRRLSNSPAERSGASPSAAC